MHAQTGQAAGLSPTLRIIKEETFLSPVADCLAGRGLSAQAQIKAGGLVMISNRQLELGASQVVIS